ncbi:hypothetical protein OF83DRAFT_1178523 [Amylostereum chailletii]|nr:hypothetical protein OF83DRAFT_1178523 [Amylostereum chailletii]
MPPSECPTPPWNLRVGRIANTREYLPFRRMLLKDGLVTEAQLNEWGSCYNSIGIRLRNVMNDLGKPFALDFDTITQPFWVSSTSGEYSDLRMLHPLVLLDGTKVVSLCTGGSFSFSLVHAAFRLIDGAGMAVCRFESAPLKKRHKRPRLALRLVKVLKPMQPSEEALERNIAIQVPKEGELFLRVSDGQPWSRVIKARSHALYALWKRWMSARQKPPDGVQSQGGRKASEKP